MKIHYKVILLLLVFFTAASCNTTRKLFGSKDEKAKTSQRRTEVVRRDNSSAPAENNHNVKENLPRTTYRDKVEEYIATYAAIAQDEMRNYRIPASITLAQGILESGAGASDLTLRANNHFGIKCHDWKGAQVFHDDDRRQECFRKYNDAKYSFRDHSLFLTERKRYAGLFELKPDDYEGWAKGLRDAGYATDRAYPAKLISLIERYQLDRFDAEVLGNNYVAYKSPRPQSGSRHVVQKGDTLYSIAKKYNTSVEQLKRDNNISGTNIAIGQELEVNIR